MNLARIRIRHHYLPNIQLTTVDPTSRLHITNCHNLGTKWSFILVTIYQMFGAESEVLDSASLWNEGSWNPACNDWSLPWRCDQGNSRAYRQAKWWHRSSVMAPSGLAGRLIDWSNDCLGESTLPNHSEGLFLKRLLLFYINVKNMQSWSLVNLCVFFFKDWQHSTTADSRKRHFNISLIFILIQ